MGDVPEQVFIDAARARVLADIGGSDLTIGPWDPEWVAQMIQAEAERPENRAAVASAYRAGQAATPDDEDEVTLGPGDYGRVSADDMAMVARATGGGIRSRELIPEFEDDDAATPDGPRTWALPDEPGPEVTAVRDRDGGTWDRRSDGWRFRIDERSANGIRGTFVVWRTLFDQYQPLTDASPAADGQDGRDG